MVHQELIRSQSIHSSEPITNESVPLPIRAEAFLMRVNDYFLSPPKPQHSQHRQQQTKQHDQESV